MQSPEMVPGLYDGTSVDSPGSSPMDYNISLRPSVSQSVSSYDAQGYENAYGGNGFMAYQLGYPTHHEGSAPVGLIPVELEIEGLYEDYDRRRRKNGSKKNVSSHVHLRRRAQNRASQRAFRDRKEKHMKGLEQRLGELEGRHTDLSRAYETLQVEYSSVKQELNRIKSNNAQNNSSSKPHQSSKDPEDSGREILDPLLFDVSAFCFDQDEGPSLRN